MKWELGRQGGDYFKFKVLESKRFKFDVYILKFPAWSYVHDHKDPCPKGYEHHRINFILKYARVGGLFYTYKEGVRKKTRKRYIRFRPDSIIHGMTQVIFGSSYWLSIGWLKKEK